MKKRDLRMDNIKAFLIILVVAGHLLELFLKNGNVKTVYKLIYSFHMPLFIFISGYFARFKPKKILAGLVLPYVVFQTIYILYVNYVIDLENEVEFGYTHPYWIMWYMMAMIVWSLSVPVISLGDNVVHLLILAASIVLSIAVGYIHSFGQDFSLSRIFVYFPFFIMGHYFSGLMKNEEKRGELTEFYHSHKIPITMGSAVLFGAAVGAMIEYTDEYSYVWLYECAPYAVSHETPLYRLAHFVVALICIMYIYLLTPDIKCGILSKLGAKTKNVYLLHGFVIIALKHMVGLV
ncbi:MAG: acyltransferase family protein [Lachnospiraceae bacterium]|nr:acyltransferase family protein [Lachnospiraceae bacterium]